MLACLIVFVYVLVFIERLYLTKYTHYFKRLEMFVCLHIYLFIAIVVVVVVSLKTIKLIDSECKHCHSAL